MVTIHFAAIALLSVLSFFLGRTFGRVESTVSFNLKMRRIISALRRVEQISELKGESLASLSPDEIAFRIQKQLEVVDDE